MIVLRDITWLWYRFTQTLSRIFLLPFRSIPTNTVNSFERFEVIRNTKVPMRDGIQLSADVYKPKETGKFPVILIRLPYGKNEYYCYMQAWGKYWAKKGYIFVAQDVRGKWRSGGEWDPFVNEAQDGYDTLDWIANQEWCDGNIGMMGESYFGYTQWAVAYLNHPNLKAIIPGVTAADIYGVWVYNNGAFCLQTLGRWAFAMDAKTYKNYHKLDFWHLPLITMDETAGSQSKTYKEFIRHPDRDEYWDQINVNQNYHKIKIPVLNVGGWYDVFLKGTIDDFLGVRKESESELARNQQRLLIGPLDHDYVPASTGKIGRIDLGKDVWDWDRYQSFFDYWLKGIENGQNELPPVEIFVIGDNEWRSENEWPLERTNYTKYYFHSGGDAHNFEIGGGLDRNIPGDELPDIYLYDPHDPTQDTLGMWLWDLSTQLKDRIATEGRPDVLTYTSDILAENLEITGPLSVTLYASSSAKDTDFTAALIDVFPDGYAQLIQEGIIRACYRNSGTKPEPLNPDEIYKFTIDLWATSYVIKKNHRFRVEISSSNFNRYDRNPNTGNKFGMDAEVGTANQTVYHNQKYPSHIILPVIP